MRKIAILLLLMFNCQWAMFNVLANDGVYYTSGNFLVPLRETDISVKKEVLEIKLCRDSFATVAVDYTLYNNNKDKTVTMAFEAAAPSNAWVPINRQGSHPFIEDFTVVFNGRNLPYRNAIIASRYDMETDFTPLDMRKWKGYGEVPDSVLPMDPVLINIEEPDSFCSFAYAYYFDAPFRKGENTVRHTYRYKMSYGVGREFEVPYALEPVIRWANGKVDDFTLRIKAEGRRDILLRDDIFAGAPFKHSRAGRHIFHLHDDYYSKCLVAELRQGDILEWHSKDFKPKDGMCIESASNLRQGVLDYAVTGNVVIDKNGRETRYLSESDDKYFVEAQNYELVPKAEAKVEFRDAEKGQGFVYLNDDIRKANVRQRPSKQSEVLFTLDNDGKTAKRYPCLGFETDESDYRNWFKVNVNGKTGYISSNIARWDSIKP